MPEATPFTRIPNWVQIALVSNVRGVEVVNTFNYQSDSNITQPAEIIAAATNWKNAFFLFCQNYSSTQQVFQKVVARTLYPAVQNLVGEYFFPVNTVGALGGNEEPGNVAASIARYSAFYGRRNRGRFYAGVFPENAIDGNNIGTGIGNLLAIFAAVLLQSYGASGILLSPVVASRAGGFLSVIRSAGLDLFVDSMRRRLTGRGR